MPKQILDYVETTSRPLPNFQNIVKHKPDVQTLNLTCFDTHITIHELANGMVPLLSLRAFRALMAFMTYLNIFKNRLIWVENKTLKYF